MVFMTTTCGHRLYLIGRVAVSALALTLLSCGGGASSKPETEHARKSPPSQSVVVVGGTSITRAAYEHWMRIGAATVTRPIANGPMPAPVTYKPPDFAACVAQARQGPLKSAPTPPLRAECKATYESIQRRVLSFLIIGYWLRAAAAEVHASVTPAEVRERFEEERKSHYPTTQALRRLEEVSRQTVPDLEFAVETQMLSARLLSLFAKEHRDQRNEQAAVPAFNKSIKSKWSARTRCLPGYVVPDCKQHHPPRGAK
jgi:hypothetical protein